MIKNKKLKQAIFLPLIFIILIWLIRILEFYFNKNFIFLGIYPLRIKNLIGLIFSPLIHANINHLISNSAPLLILGTGLFYFYKRDALKIFGLIYLMSGIWVWLSGRFAYHIGASGLVFGLVSYIFLSGLLSKKKELMAISLLVSFLYGSLIWGILPIKSNVSWEGHLGGFISGIVLSVYYNRKKRYNNAEEHITNKEHYNIYNDFDSTNKSIKIRYNYKKTKKQ